MIIKSFKVETEVKNANGSMVKKFGTAEYSFLENTQELISAIQKSEKEAKKILTDVNRQRKTDAGNQVRAKLKATDPQKAEVKALASELKTKNISIDRVKQALELLEKMDAEQLLMIPVNNSDPDEVTE